VAGHPVCPIAFRVRPATPADLAALVRLRLAVQAHSERSSSSAWRMTPKAKARAGDELAEQIASSDALVLVACDEGGESVGMAVGQVQRQEKYEPAVSGMIRRVYVAEDWRRRGVGRALIRGVLGFFREKDVEDLSLRYIPGNADAERFWSGLGFRPSLIQAGAKLGDLAERLGADAADLDRVGDTETRRQGMLEAIYARRSIRQYTDEPVSEGDIQELLKAAMAAPSANDQQPWHFCVVTDREKLDALAEVLPYGKMLFKAPLALVVCGDPSISSRFWVQDCSAATENLLVAVAGLGLGAVWLGVEPNAERVRAVAGILGIPDEMGVLNVISVGHPAEEKESRTQYDAARVHRNRW
jgi:nitroreductase/GNAT superfamily N-acetyltransferase